MAAVSQTTYANAFLNDIYQFRLKFHCFFQGVQLTISSIDSGNALALARRQAKIWTSDALLYFGTTHMYHSTSMVNELLRKVTDKNRRWLVRVPIQAGQNDRHFAYDIFKFTSLYESAYFNFVDICSQWSK